MRIRMLHKALLLFAMCFLLVSCGEKEQQEETDAYVYIARQVSVPAKDQYGNQRVKDLKTANGYLYYLYDDFDYDFGVKTKQYGIRKIALDGEVNLADSELVVGADDLMKYGTDNEFPMSDPLIKAYAVDHEQRVYLFIYNREIWGEAENGILVSKTTEGEGDFALILPTAFAVDGDMLVVNEEYIAVLLPGSIIRLIDKSGNIIGNIPVKSSLLELESEYGWKEQLLLGEEGKIYYSIEARYQWKREVYEVIVNEKKLKKVESLSGQFSSERYFALYGSSQGLIYAEINYYDFGNGTLYLYNEKEDSFEELLHWADSNIQEDILMDNVLWVDEDTVVACRFRNSHFTGSTEEGLYVLRKTAVQDIPQKEEVVIACNEPSASLLNCVAEFNRSNDTYHINVKMYQGDGWNNRFDSSLVSSEPPDLLDLSFMDIEKYARKGTLADLTPYLDKSDVLDRENYLENALEGYTYDGRLVCIPKDFYFYEILGRASQIDSSKAWDIKAVMELTEQYPDCRLLNLGDISISTYYMLEHFIDWEEGTCSLDGEEFREFVQWMVKYDTNAPLVHDVYVMESSLSDDILLGYYPMFCIRDYIANRAKMEGQGVSVGYPTEDGKGTYQAYVKAALCMTTNSQHKEGAWAFLEYYLTREGEYGMGMEGGSFPTRRDLLLESIQEAATKREKVVEVDGKIITPLDMNGEPVLERKFTYSLNGEIFDCYYITEEQAEELLGMIESLDFKPLGGSKEEALQIIREELSDYQSGNKTLEEVTDIIQSRVALLLSE